MIFCMNCHERFSDYEEYSRHKWNDHAGEVDQGEKFV